DLSMIFPLLPDGNSVSYVLRTMPGQRAQVLKQATNTLQHLDDNRVVEDGETFEAMRAGYFQSSRTMVQLLIATALALMFVTALGSAGLASFWVTQRTRRIGVRRAVGATRGDILRYFQTENFLIVTLGVVLGVLLAVGLNLLLMQHYALPRLPWWYLLAGAAV